MSPLIQYIGGRGYITVINMGPPAEIYHPPQKCPAISTLIQNIEGGGAIPPSIVDYHLLKSITLP